MVNLRGGREDISWQIISELKEYYIIAGRKRTMKQSLYFFDYTYINN